MAKATVHLARHRRHQRVRKTVVGTPERPRLNVFRSNNHVYAQVIDDTRGHTIAAAAEVERAIRGDLDGRNKTERAAHIGRILADRAKEQGVTAVVFDRGGYKYHGRVRAVAEAAREAGLEF